MTPLETQPAAQVILLGLIAGLVIILDGRSIRIGLLALHYLVVAWLSASVLPASVAAVKLVAGLLTCGILAVSVARLQAQAYQPRGGALPAGRWFRLASVAMIASAATGLARTNWIGIPNISPAALTAATLLMGLGLLQLGLSQAELRMGSGLILLLSGFEIAYGFVEPSLAVLALLGSVHIGIALVVSYLILAEAGQDESGMTT